MADLRERFRASSGAAVWHLLILVGAFALAGWVALRLAGEPAAVRMLVWFVSAVIAHDLVLFPIYATVDRGLRCATRGRPCPLNHIRVPALASGLLFLVFLPGILKQGKATYAAATGQDQQPYLGRWLGISLALFVISGLWYAARLIRRRPS
ncbi:MAG TPA: hypothetical protein VFY84_11250 [Jiangellales bacterium]|nr:hypothetical protein [Jiangellales bacterium]